MQQYLIVEEAVSHAVVHGTHLLQAAMGAAPESRSDSSGTFRLDGGLHLSRDGVPAEGVLLDEARQLALLSVEGAGLAKKLTILNCPLTLRRRAQACSARLMDRAGELGFLIKQPIHIPSPGSPAFIDLFEFARSCSTERCVSDTYRAARASFLARAAQDPELRGVLSTIAADLLSQAVLAWELLDWAQSQLSPARARLIREEQRRACQSLHESLASGAGGLVPFLGDPGKAVADGLLEALEFALWGDDFAMESKAC